MTKLIMIGIFTLVHSITFASKSKFEEISKNVSVGNGRAWVDNYKMRKNIALNAENLKSKGLKDLKWEIDHEASKSCRPWFFSTDNEALTELDETENQTTRKQLEELIKSKDVLTVAIAKSNGNVECSKYYLNVYGADKSVLKIRILAGD